MFCGNVRRYDRGGKRIHSSDSGNPRFWRLYGSVKDVIICIYIVKISSQRRMENCPTQRLCMEDLWLFTAEWRPEICRVRRIIRARCGMHFEVVADKLDLSSTQKRKLEKENYNFDCVVNKSVYVAPTVHDNCAHSHLFFHLAAFICFTRVSEGHFWCCVISRNGNFK